MNLIERYIFRKTGIANLLILCSLAGVVWVVQALREIDIITSNGQTIVTFFSMTSLAVPNLVTAIIPVALLLSTINIINGMNQNSELVVMSASGYSNWRLAKPMLTLALICSLFVGAVGHFVSPWSLLKLRHYITEMRADLVSVVIREGTFNSIEEGLTFHIANRGAGGLLHGILISDDRDDDVSIIYSANEGYVARNAEGSFLLMKDGEIQQTNQKDGSVTLVKYKSYIFDLSSFSGSTAVRAQKAKELTTPELLTIDPDHYVYKNSPGRYRAQINERFAEMLWPFAYVFIVLAFAGQARSSRQNYAASVWMASIIVIAARGMSFSAISSVPTNPSALVYVYALPLSCVLFGAWYVIANKPAALPKPVLDRMERTNRKIAGIFADYVKAYRQFQRRRAGVGT